MRSSAIPTRKFVRVEAYEKGLEKKVRFQEPDAPEAKSSSSASSSPTSAALATGSSSSSSTMAPAPPPHQSRGVASAREAPMAVEVDRPVAPDMRNPAVPPAPGLAEDQEMEEGRKRQREVDDAARQDPRSIEYEEDEEMSALIAMIDSGAGAVEARLDEVIDERNERCVRLARANGKNYP